MLKELLNRIEGKFAIKTGVAATAGWTIGVWFSTLLEHPGSIVSGLWCAVSAIFVVQSYIGGSYQAALNRLLGVCIGCVLGSLGTIFFGSNPLSLGLSVTITVILCTFMNITGSVRIASMSASVVMILGALQPQTPSSTFAFFRVIDSALGIITGLVVSHLLWPVQAARSLRLNIAELIFVLHQLFALVTKTEEWDKHLKEELFKRATAIREALQKDMQFLDEAKLELLMWPERLEHWAILHSHLEDLFKIILTFKKTYKSTKQISDAPLFEQISRVLVVVDHHLKQLSHQLTLRQPVGPQTELQKALSDLHEALAHFRSTHTTKGYNLQDVENFFVFFYNLEAIGKEMEKIAQRIDLLYQNVNL